MEKPSIVAAQRPAQTVQRQQRDDRARSPTTAVDDSHRDSPAWSEVVRRGRRGSRRGQGKRIIERRAQPTTPTATTSVMQTLSRTKLGKHQNPAAAWVKVDGARKVWGTLKSSTTASVKSAISRVCNNNTVKVKRKFKVGSGTQETQARWWYVLHDSEEALVSLETNWERLALQTSCMETGCML